uniref:Uncharacterized protein n=1 Tax=Chlamydomonas leiostraca TaxID=1034604 RepID=A0A7S0R2M2_9CHLO|mmetsp:Transcript_12323/g.30153  ORF Transcript_12323/g.30153 Transcript_12323/m.30153 type:complete len:193 (+) Transcript_12323:108-686(+)|eukprot:CAMPEP_0202876540 /NCGR_PEP_ID=MMETSP1391-20130828/29163_1 /ASSEMBLY_ACC=CAM_ASM_000867 /TAXON_ID=1034604 /ORGANISM="Chlamydomonas leiostraca, Strain SAG 11-49" /LENGTH=192 /DNA_ID=CAMNT_0049558413 /DNA_START=21 /DNA_END=599 /DNA_ORIENTATION=+
MACYWGCGTKPAKCVWAAVALLVLTGIVLIVAGLIGGFTGDKCFELYRDCMDVFDDTGFCQRVLDDQCKLRTWLRLVIAGVIIFIVGCLTTSYFCCCAKGPDREQTTVVTQQVVQMGQAPAGYTYGYAQPGAQPMVVQAMPVAGVPVAPPPGFTPAAPGAAAYPAYYPAVPVAQEGGLQAQPEMPIAPSKAV